MRNVSEFGLPRGYWLGLTYSPDDGGHYYEVVGAKGRTVYVTGIGSKADVQKEALEWARAHPYVEPRSAGEIIFGSEAENERMKIADAPKLYEAGNVSRYDQVVVTEGGTCRFSREKRGAKDKEPRPVTKDRGAAARKAWATRRAAAKGKA